MRIGKQQKNEQNNAKKNSRFFEIAGVVVPLDHIATFIVNANHGIV